MFLASVLTSKLLCLDIIFARSLLLLLISMIQGYQVRILEIFFSSLYPSWRSTKSIWQFLRATRQPTKGCQKLYYQHLITDLASRWQTYSCDYARVLVLVFQRTGNHLHHQFFSKYVATTFCYQVIFMWIDFSPYRFFPFDFWCNAEVAKRSLHKWWRIIFIFSKPSI